MSDPTTTHASAELRSLIEFASEAAGKIFLNTGLVRPMWHAVKRNGQQLILPTISSDKDIGTMLARAAFALHDVVRYVFIDEAWVVDMSDRSGGPAISQAELARMNREGLSHHPDRREVLLLSGEDHACGMVMARRYILRPERGKATLTPLEYFGTGPGGTAEGRMVGLLPTGKGKPS